MHDSRPRLFPRFGHFRKPEQQRVHQRSGAIPGRRMHDEPGRLVDHDDVLVVVDDGQRNVFRLEVDGIGSRNVDQEIVAFENAVRAAYFAPASRHVTVSQQLLKS